jgi:hypothetical protein
VSLVSKCQCLSRCRCQWSNHFFRFFCCIARAYLVLRA